MESRSYENRSASLLPHVSRRELAGANWQDDSRGSDLLCRALLPSSFRERALLEPVISLYNPFQIDAEIKFIAQHDLWLSSPELSEHFEMPANIAGNHLPGISISCSFLNSIGDPFWRSRQAQLLPPTWRDRPLPQHSRALASAYTG